MFFDLEKAYDATWKCGILSDFRDPDFRGHLPLFIEGSLSQGHFNVRVDSMLSELHEHEMGVP